MLPEEIVEASARENLWEAEPVKRCTKCKVIKGFSGFYTQRNHSDGLHSWCMECIKEKERRYREANREKLAERQRERRRAIMADPVRAARQREQQRKQSARWREKAKLDPAKLAKQQEWKRAYRERVAANPKRARQAREAKRLREALRRRREGKPEVPQRRPVWTQVTPREDTAPLLPVGPFRAWLASRISKEGGDDEAIKRQAAALGVSVRQVSRVLSGEVETVKLDTVDRALTVEGVTGLWELYPELYEDAA